MKIASLLKLFLMFNVILFSFLFSSTYAAKITVWPKQKFTTISSAVSSANSWDIIIVNAWTYLDENIKVTKPLSLIWSGWTVKIKWTKNIANWKAFIISQADLTLQNFSFENARVTDKNWAWIRYEKWNLKITNCTFINNQDWILGWTYSWGIITIDNSLFSWNWQSLDGYTHGIYIWNISSVTVTNSKFYWTRVWHHIKSRAQSTIIKNNILDDLNADTSYSIDIPNWWNAVISSNTITKWPKSQNSKVISYWAEWMKYSDNSLVVSLNTIKSLRSITIWVWNSSNEMVLITNNTFISVKTIFSGLAKLVNNKLK